MNDFLLHNWQFIGTIFAIGIFYGATQLNFKWIQKSFDSMERRIEKIENHFFGGKP